MEGPMSGLSDGLGFDVGKGPQGVFDLSFLHANMIVAGRRTGKGGLARNWTLGGKAVGIVRCSGGNGQSPASRIRNSAAYTGAKPGVPGSGKEATG